MIFLYYLGILAAIACATLIILKRIDGKHCEIEESLNKITGRIRSLECDIWVCRSGIHDTFNLVMLSHHDYKAIRHKYGLFHRSLDLYDIESKWAKEEYEQICKQLKELGVE